MATASNDTTSKLAFLSRALKAPALHAAAGRLTNRARAQTWVLRGVPDRLPATRSRRPRRPQRSGTRPRRPVPRAQVTGGLRLRPQRSLRREQIAILGTLDFVAAESVF